MALFGKTFKLYYSEVVISDTSDNTNTLRAFNEKVYMQDISLACPVLSSLPTNISSSSLVYADNQGVLNPSTGTLLDGNVPMWEQTFGLYGDTLQCPTQRISNIMSIFPSMIHLDLDTYPSYIIWDGVEGHKYAVLFARKIWGSTYDAVQLKCVRNITTGDGGGMSGAQAFLKTFRKYGTEFYIPFKVGNSIYLYYVRDNGSVTSNMLLASRSSASLSDELWDTFWADASDDYKPIAADSDPYSQGGNSEGGIGGNGTFSDTSDIIGIPSLPTLSAVDTGFITLFNPSASQIKALADYMWSNNFNLSLFKNIVANPIECILGLSIVPVNPPNAGSKALVVGNIPTDVAMPYLSSQYVEVDCGTLNIVEFWGSI